MPVYRVRISISVNRVQLFDDEGRLTHRVDAVHDDGLIYATLATLDDTRPQADPEVIFACRRQTVFLALARAYLFDTVCKDRSFVLRYQGRAAA